MCDHGLFQVQGASGLTYWTASPFEMTATKDGTLVHLSGSVAIPQTQNRERSGGAHRINSNFPISKRLLRTLHASQPAQCRLTPSPGVTLQKRATAASGVAIRHELEMDN